MGCQQKVDCYWLLLDGEGWWLTVTREGGEGGREEGENHVVH